MNDQNPQEREREANSQDELAAVREDAGRYQWLREHTTYRDIGYTSDPSGRTGMLCTPLQRRWYHDSRLLTCDTLDAAIDAERARKETE